MPDSHRELLDNVLEGVIGTNLRQLPVKGVRGQTSSSSSSSSTVAGRGELATLRRLWLDADRHFSNLSSPSAGESNSPPVWGSVRAGVEREEEEGGGGRRR